MKKTFVLLAACALMGTLTAQEVTIKKGKATMTEAQYNELKAKADAYDSILAAPATFNDSARMPLAVTSSTSGMPRSWALTAAWPVWP